MNTVWNRARLIIATAWVGSLWTVGYLVAPTLFKTLTDQALAGTIAGQLFFVEACFSMVCGLYLLGFFYYQHKRLSRLIAGMLLCTLLGYFAVHPFMTDLRASGLINPDIRRQFGILHGIASGFYLMQSILGAMLILEPLEKV